MNLREYTRQYCEKDNRLASLSYFGTFAVYFSSLYLAITHVHLWYVMTPMASCTRFPPCAFMCCNMTVGTIHCSDPPAERIAGDVLSPFTFAPFEVMKQNHNLHHANVGNLEHRETGEINTMTLREWNAGRVWQRLHYRLYRNPFVLVPVGSLFTYFIRYRWPKNTTRFGVVGVLLHNLAVWPMSGCSTGLSAATGLAVWFGASMLGGMIGVFLVYLQHNFEDTYWDRRPDLDPQLAAIQGSSCLDFGWGFDTVACITLHDIHHLNSRIPSYRLRACHYSLPEIAPRRIKFPEAVAALNLKLWDEDQQWLVPFPRPCNARSGNRFGCRNRLVEPRIRRSQGGRGSVRPKLAPRIGGVYTGSHRALAPVAPRVCRVYPQLACLKERKPDDPDLTRQRNRPCPRAVAGRQGDHHHRSAAMATPAAAQKPRVGLRRAVATDCRGAGSDGPDRRTQPANGVPVATDVPPVADPEKPKTSGEAAKAATAKVGKAAKKKTKPDKKKAKKDKRGKGKAKKDKKEKGDKKGLLQRAL